MRCFDPRVWGWGADRRNGLESEPKQCRCLEGYGRNWGPGNTHDNFSFNKDLWHLLPTEGWGGARQLHYILPKPTTPKSAPTWLKLPKLGARPSRALVKASGICGTESPFIYG